MTECTISIPDCYTNEHSKAMFILIRNLKGVTITHDFGDGILDINADEDSYIVIKALAKADCLCLEEVFTNE